MQNVISVASRLSSQTASSEKSRVFSEESLTDYLAHMFFISHLQVKVSNYSLKTRVMSPDFPAEKYSRVFTVSVDFQVTT